MTYSSLTGIDIPISNIIFGCCNPILTDDKPGAEELLDLAYSNGFNIFDTAKVYGKSEDVLGRWIEHSGNRDRLVIVTKGCHPNETGGVSRLNVNALNEDIESSLERLRTDYIDIYLLHRDNPEASIESVLPVIESLENFIRRGIIKKIGVSNWKHTRIEAVNTLAFKMGLEGISVSSPQLSPAKQIRDPWGGGCVSIAYDDDAEEWYRNHPEVVVFAYSCLAHGMFSGKITSRHPFKLYRDLDYAGRKGYWSLSNFKRLLMLEKVAARKECTVAQASLVWCMSRGYRVFPVATMSSLERMRENIGALL